MVAKLVGSVTSEEKVFIQQLFERKNGLNELAKIITSENNELYEKVVKDLGETSSKFQKWWDDMNAKYSWQSEQNGHWEIDFESNNIYLVTEG
jgi:hypothetical protein